MRMNKCVSTPDREPVTDWGIGPTQWGEQVYLIVVTFTSLGLHAGAGRLTSSCTTEEKVSLQ